MQRRFRPRSTCRALARWIPVIAVLIVFGVQRTALAQDPTSQSIACSALASGDVGDADAAPVLSNCLARPPANGIIELAPIVFHLRTPLVIDRAVKIRTLGEMETAPTCDPNGGPGCATILLETPPMPGTLPIDVRGAGVEISHVVFRGQRGRDPERDVRQCQDPRLRPSGGGLRVQGNNFRLIGAVIRDVTCYTALEVTATAKRTVILRNHFGPNGAHVASREWADGLTIHDNAKAIVSNNVFLNNTDVQLILGGCQDCVIEDNVFRHGPAVASSAYADLMLHAWRTTSGDFTGTVISGNRIDCGPERRCGFGIEIGPNPWGPTSHVFGARVVRNDVANAMVGINVDGVSGPIDLEGNQVRASGGTYAPCGDKTWSAINIAPQARPFVRGIDLAIAGAQNSARCLLNRPPNPSQ